MISPGLFQSNEYVPYPARMLYSRLWRRYNLLPMSKRRNPSGLHDPKVSVVIPVYNEKATIDEILRRVIEAPMRKEIVVVDDCSTDGTRQILENLVARQARGDAFANANDGDDPIELRDLRFFFQSQNQGKGAALRRGFAETTGEIVLVQDADLESEPHRHGDVLQSFSQRSVARDSDTFRPVWIRAGNHRQSCQAQLADLRSAD